jgi:predicted nucleic acid-binding protein
LMPRYALDSNFMAYAEGVDDRRRQERAARLVSAIDTRQIVVPLQAAGELLRVLTRKINLDPREAVARVAVWLRYPTQDTDRRVIEDAMEIVSRHPLQIWDAIILAAAEAAGASVLLSEDMQDGFRWRSVTIANPFMEEPSPIISRILNN